MFGGLYVHKRAILSTLKSLELERRHPKRDRGRVGIKPERGGKRSFGGLHVPRQDVF